MAEGDAIDCCPPLTLRLELAASGATEESRFRALPAKPGVFALEDDTGRTLSLITTADLRRAAAGRLAPPTADQAKSPRTDLRGVARRVCAVTVGSAFEADWAYLQLARKRLPHSYRHMFDRWQAWFVHCDSQRPFPQWVKTSRPGAPPTGRAGTYVGPFADKHVAHRFIELLEDAFDLCRYHHILVQAPHASPCAYKEMGRCPAPCDGSITMPAYLQQVRDSIDFARDPISARAQWTDRMRAASAAMDFETAQLSKTRLDRTAVASKTKFAHARDLRDFRFVAVLPGERTRWARIMLIDGGRIEPLLDAHAQADAEVIAAVISERAASHSSNDGDSQFSNAAIENMGLVCRHLLLPRAEARRRRAEFLPWRNLDGQALSAAIAQVTRESSAAADTAPVASIELELEGG